MKSSELRKIPMGSYVVATVESRKTLLRLKRYTPEFDVNALAFADQKVVGKRESYRRSPAVSIQIDSFNRHTILESDMIVKVTIIKAKKIKLPVPIGCCGEVLFFEGWGFIIDAYYVPLKAARKLARYV